jgi:hypothetical protein
MADALRGSMDSSEYKHVVLGLIFLKYISDAFEEHHAMLVAEQSKSADPEDPYAFSKCVRGYSRTNSGTCDSWPRTDVLWIPLWKACGKPASCEFASISSRPLSRMVRKLASTTGQPRIRKVTLARDRSPGPEGRKAADRAGGRSSSAGVTVDRSGTQVPLNVSLKKGHRDSSVAP